MFYYLIGLSFAAYGLLLQFGLSARLSAFSLAVLILAGRFVYETK